MNKKNVTIAICGLLAFLMLLPLFYYVGMMNNKQPSDPIQGLVPDEDHILGVVLITNEECQEELLSCTKERVCEFYKDEINSIASLAKWLDENDNTYALISDGDRHNPNMYILCNGSEAMEDYKQDFISDEIVCKRSKTDTGTEKQIILHPEKEGHIWLLYTRKGEPGSYYLYDQQVLYTGDDKWQIEQTTYGEYGYRTYEHHVSIVIG